HHGAIAHISELFLLSAAVLAKLEDRTEIFVWRQDCRLDPRFLHLLDMIWFRHIDRIVNLKFFPGGELDLINDGRGGRDQIEIEFARQTLLNDFQMQKAEETAAKTETKCCRGFHLVREACIVEA